MKWFISFERPYQPLNTTPSIVWEFPFTIIDASLRGSLNKNQLKKQHLVRVKIDRILTYLLGFNLKTEHSQKDHLDLMKVMFEYGKRYINQKLKEKGSLDLEEEFVFNRSIIEPPLLCDPSQIANPEDTRYLIDTDLPQNQPTSVNINNQGSLNIYGDIAGRDISNKDH